MIDKKDLLLKASTEDDEDRLNKLTEYDSQQGGLMLYRYRHLSDTTQYEFDALRNCKIWASNPQFFDDKYEFLPTSISKKDNECLRFFLERELEHETKKERRKKLNEIDKQLNSNGRALLKLFIGELKKARSEFAVSCFTENDPCETNHNMWEQYAQGSGICLGYSLKSFIKSGIIIDPVYYVDSKEKSLGNMFELFGKNIRAALCFCIKENYGMDQFSKESDKICWSDQKEWRFAIPNKFDKLKNEYAKGRYLERKIVPDVVYIKDLNIKLFIKVWLAAKRNGIKIKRIS